MLNSTPNLILDLLDNGGGSDNAWEGLIPYFYTQPIKMIGADILASETTISAYKKYLDDKNLSKADFDNINNKVARMEKAKEQWVRNNEDETDSSLQPKPYPKKIVILINKWCGSQRKSCCLQQDKAQKLFWRVKIRSEI